MLSTERINETVEKRRKFIINVAYFTILIVMFCLFLKFAFQPLLPIFIAGFVAVLLQKPVNKLVAKTKISKGIVSPLMVIFVFGVIVLLFYLIGERLLNELYNFVSFIRLKIEDYAWIEKQIYNVVNALPGFLRDAVVPSANEFLEKLKPAMESDAASGVYKISFSAIDISSLTSQFGSGVFETAKQIPSILVAAIVTIILSCFATTEYDILSAAVKRLVPGGENNIVSAVKRVLMTSVWKLIKAYFCICCITFLEMLTGLTLLKLLGVFESDYIFAISLLAAIFDILPVVGIGAILWPWAIFNLVTGNTVLGIGLIALYIIITVVRQIIEPKFVAGQMSMPAAVTLAVMYTGLKAFGVIGMFAFTIAMYCIKALDSEGVIHIFRNEEEL